MNIIGAILLTISIGLVTSLSFFCYYKILTFKDEDLDQDRNN